MPKHGENHAKASARSVEDENGRADSLPELSRHQPKQASGYSTSRVLGFVILQIFSALNRPPPGLVIFVPLDGGFDRLFKLVFRRPPQFVLDLCRIDSVPPIMPG